MLSLETKDMVRVGLEDGDVSLDERDEKMAITLTLDRVVLPGHVYCNVYLRLCFMFFVSMQNGFLIKAVGAF